jgi:lantibiotic modifying enzyme
MLFESDRHEALCDSVWDESLARETIQSIVHDIEQSRLAEDRWPVHPRDDEGDVPRTGFKSLYLGSAGVLWALWYLRREGAVELGTDPSDGIDKVYRAYLSDPDGRRIVPSYFMGEAGILLVLWRLTQSSTAADRLYTSVESNIQNPTNEELWAAPGTMVAAWHLWEATGEGRWRDLFLRNVEQLWQTWAFDEKARCHLWTQDMLGKVVQYFGAGHGFAGNVYPLLRGASLLDAGRRETLYDRCLAMLRATARVEGDAVNWPEGTYTPRPGRTCFSMQWCHGAPGIVTGLADFPPQRSLEVEALLVGAGRAIWKAGPLTKGYGLCHGTAGNGYAFLKLYQRTGDTRWLERARSFAAHSIVQRDRMRQQYGQGRYALWTGDPGLAVYIWHCLDGTAKLPGLDVLQ